MIKAIESVVLFSEDAKKLAEFYRDKLGLNLTLEAEVGEGGEELFGFEFGAEAGFYIVDHSGVKGKNPQPERMMVNFEVDKIEGEVKKLDEAGVRKITDTYHMQDYGMIATFEDIDGNFFQLVQVKPS